jgi:hypothetical protein
MPSASNMQVASLGTRRPLVLAFEPGEARIPVRVRLRRHGRSLDGGSSTLRLQLKTAGGRVLTEREETVSWQRGQRARRRESALLLEDAEAQALLEGNAPQFLRVIVQIAPSTETPEDVLEADDRRGGVVVLRRRLEAVLLGDPTREGMHPARWLQAALQPEAREQPAIRVRREARVEGAAVSDADALLITAPHRIEEEDWGRLAAAVADGALLWAFPVPDPAAGEAFPPAMERALELGSWETGLIEEAEEQGGWSLRTNEDAPRPLRRLAGDWSALLQPVRVHRRARVAPPSAHRWLTLRGPAAPTLMAGLRRERGTVALLATALDPGWSNLPTTPLFVPLVQETLRGSAALALPRLIRKGAAPGDRPALPSGAGEAASLRGPEGGAIAIEQREGTPQPARALKGLGAYRWGENPTQLFPVNPDPEEGDLRPLSRARLIAWAGGRKRVTWLQGREHPFAETDARGADLTAPLLLAALLVLLLETVAARRTSHAGAGPPLLQLLARRLRLGRAGP